MKNVLARILVHGDLHLHSGKYGAHVNYAKESMGYYEYITNKVEEYGITHVINAGDLTFGRFTDLEYRKKYEELTDRQLRQTQGRHWIIKGNHDSSTRGMTEYEFYLSRGKFRSAENFKIGNVNINMIEHYKVGFEEHKFPELIGGENEINVVIAHNYYKFKDTNLPEYGNEAINLDECGGFFGVDYLVCGHIHTPHMFMGQVIKDSRSHDLVVEYLGCPTRPAYLGENMYDKVKLLVLTVYDDGTMEYDSKDMQLLPLEESFTLADMADEEELSKLKRVDVSDVVSTLASYDRMVGDPEHIIMNMSGLKKEYRDMAVHLLKTANE